MVREDRVTAEFEASRPRLHALAYRMLGSRAEAEDAVQDTWLRLGRTDPGAVDNLGGWLTTVVARVCLDRLRSRRSRREEPLDEKRGAEVRTTPDDHDPAHQALMADSIGAALLVVLDSLRPAERVAFVLHDVFAVPFDEIAEIVERSPEAARQLASRARRRVQGTPPAVDVDLVRQRNVVAAFLRAAQGGDFEALLRLLDPDVLFRPDAVALRLGAFPETRGAEAVAGQFSGGAQVARLAVIDAVAGLVFAPGGRIRGVAEFELRDDKIASIHVTGDPERIRDLDIVILDE